MGQKGRYFSVRFSAELLERIEQVRTNFYGVRCSRAETIRRLVEDRIGDLMGHCPGADCDRLAGDGGISMETLLTSIPSTQPLPDPASATLPEVAEAAAALRESVAELVRLTSALADLNPTSYPVATEGRPLRETQ